MTIRFGLRIPPCADVRQVAATARAAEEAGFDVARLPDSQFLWRDVWAAMALAAISTERIALGTCVTQFETRHATVTAAAAVTIDELAPGRTILGVGTGDSFYPRGSSSYTLPIDILTIFGRQVIPRFRGHRREVVS